MRQLLHSRAFGYSQETIALKFLARQGMKLLRRNFSCRTGEIDLIMLHPPEQLVFVEVRYRKSATYGSATASVTHTKQARIKRTAATFLQSHSCYQSLACRYDIVAITGAADGNENLQWIRHAFY